MDPPRADGRADHLLGVVGLEWPSSRSPPKNRSAIHDAVIAAVHGAVISEAHGTAISGVQSATIDAAPKAREARVLSSGLSLDAASGVAARSRHDPPAIGGPGLLR